MTLRLAPHGNGHGIVTTCNPDTRPLTTGLENADKSKWYYFRRLHIGATAWYIFAERRYNPYWGTMAQTSPQWTRYY